MMPPPIALHTAARRFVMNRMEELGRELEEFGTSRICVANSEAFDKNRRYSMARAILEVIERTRAEELESLAFAREYLIAEGSTAVDLYTHSPDSSAEKRAYAAERSDFVQYLRSVSEADLQSLEPLPYRRVLLKSEVAKLRRMMLERWQTDDGYWYPITELERPDLIAFKAWKVEPMLERLIGEVLPELGIERLFEIREYGPSYELDIELWEPYYTGVEGFFLPAVPETMQTDWILYASHESSFTVGGEAMISRIKAIWPEWEQHIYIDAFT